MYAATCTIQDGVSEDATPIRVCYAAYSKLPN